MKTDKDAEKSIMYVNKTWLKFLSYLFLILFIYDSLFFAAGALTNTLPIFTFIIAVVNIPVAVFIFIYGLIKSRKVDENDK